MSAAAQPAHFSAPGSAWARQGADSIAAALRIISDLTAQEVALLVGMARERMTTRPAAGVVETAGKAASQFTDFGKILLDLAAGESAIAVESLKELFRLRPSASAIADLIPRGVGTMVELHKHLLESVGGQVREFTEAYAEGKPLIPAQRVAKATREAVESFIETQKTFLDEVAEQVTVATEAPKEAKGARRERSKVLIQLSREGVDRFIEAQKQVLEMIDRMDSERGHAHPKHAPQTSLAELTRKSVRNFTTAQKSLLDLAMKPVAEGPEKTARPARRRPKPRRKAAKA